MNAIERMAYTYASVHLTLVKWATEYVGRDRALIIVQTALAELFRLACNAYETLDGPYKDLADTVMVRMVSVGFIDPLGVEPWPMRTLGIPGEDDVCEIAHLYATVYHCAYSASWTLAEREEIYQWIRCTTPPVVQDDPSHVIEIQWDSAPHAVRRAVEEAIHSHCSGQLVCVISEQIWANEDRKGCDWLKDMTV